MKKITLILFMLGSLVARAQTLEDYFEIAADQNPGLKAKYKEFEAALEKIPQVSSLPDPTFSFGYFISPVETRVGPQRAKFSLTQMFPWFGTLKAQNDAAALWAEAKHQAFLEARNKLYFQVSAAYYPLYEWQKWQEIEARNITLLETYKTLATSRFENAKGPMVDVLRADLLLKDAQTNLEILQTKGIALRAAFNQLLNRPVSDPVALADTLTTSPIYTAFDKDSLLTYHPLLTEMDLKMRASEANATAAYRQSLPKLGVGLDYVMVGQRQDVVMPDNGKDVLMPMVSVSIPIFRNKYEAGIREAERMQESYQYQQQDLANSLEASFNGTMYELHQHHTLLTLYDAQIVESHQILQLLLSAYSNGGAGFEEILRVDQQLLKYEKMKITSLVQYHIALAKMDYLTAITK